MIHETNSSQDRRLAHQQNDHIFTRMITSSIKIPTVIHHSEETSDMWKEELTEEYSVLMGVYS